MKTSLSQFFEDYKNVKLDQVQKDKIYDKFLSKVGTDFAHNQTQDNDTTWLENIYSYLKTYTIGYRVAVVLLLMVFVIFSANIKDFIINNYTGQDIVYADSIGQIVKVDGKYAIVIDNISYQTDKIYDGSIMVVQSGSKVDFVVNEKIVGNIYGPAKLSFRKIGDEYALNLIEGDKLELHSNKTSSTQSIQPQYSQDNISDQSTTDARISTQEDHTKPSNKMKVTITTPKFIAKTTDEDIDLKVSTHGTNQVIINQNGPVEITDTKGDKSLLLANQYAIIDSEVKLFKNMAKLDEDIAGLTPEVKTFFKTDKQPNLDELKDIYSTKIKQNLSTDTSHTDYDLLIADVDNDDDQNNLTDADSIIDSNIPNNTNATVSSGTIVDAQPIDTTISTDDSVDTAISSNVTIEKNSGNESIDDILSKKKLLSQEQLYTLELINSNYISGGSLIYIKEYIMKGCKLFGLLCPDTDDDSTLKTYLNRVITTAKNSYYIDHTKVIDIR